jgi:uncharacterized protein (TIGR02246 family)
MTPTDIVRASIDTWNDADRQGFLGCYAEDCEIVSPGLEGSGHDGVAQFWTSIMTGMPDCRVEVVHLVAEGDLVAEEARSRGTNTGPISAPDGSELPPTGRTADLPFSAVHTVRGDRIVSSRFYWDTLTFLGQLGASGS